MTTSFVINNELYAVKLATLPADITLNTFLREKAQLTATKYMCLEGGCGLCICVVKVKHPVTGRINTLAVNSCVTLLNVCRDWEIITSEGIGNKHNGYHPIQKRLAKLNGTQCGYCSPGFVMNMFGLMQSKDNKLTMKEIENSFGGNLCRCTGYRPILYAMKSFALDSNISIPSDCGDIEDTPRAICGETDIKCSSKAVFCQQKLQFNHLIYDDGRQWYWPKTLNETLMILYQMKDCTEYMLVSGNTGHGVYRRSPNITVFIDINAVKDLKEYKVQDEVLTLGGNLSLTETMNIFMEIAEKPGFEYCQRLYNHFDLIANVPVRNTGTLSGNICLKKDHPEFPSDVFITFEALDAQIVVASNPINNLIPQKMSLMEFLSKKLERFVIVAFELKAYPKHKHIFQSYKIMPRSQNAHAYVNCAFLLHLNIETGLVNKACICFGGIRPSFVHAYDIESILSGKSLWYDRDILKIVFVKLQELLQPDAVLPDASPEYRRLLACGLLYKFFLNITPKDKINKRFESGGEILERFLSSGKQTFATDEKTYPVTMPIEKIEALIQCSGEAKYVNDILTAENTVFCAFVTAKKVGAVIESIDATDALKMPGVIAFFSSKDIPGKNAFFDKSYDQEDEEIFCSSQVKHYDQPLGVIAAMTVDIAQRAVHNVNIIYSHGTDIIFPTVNCILKAKQLDRVKCQNKSIAKEVDLSVEYEINGSGIFEIGSQYHFTMEPHSTVIVPLEEGLQVWSSTQWMDHTQFVIANMLQLKTNNVQLKVRRIGGAYGAKVSRGNQVACAAALVAYKLNRPTRFVQTIESMMSSLGKRWACRSEYEFHVAKNGKIIRLQNIFYEDAGCTLNENPINYQTIISARSCYDLTDLNYKIEGNAVLTDAPSATWCRAPGSVEGTAMIENIMEHIAFTINLDPVDVRLTNIKDNNKIRELLPCFIESSEYRQRRKNIIEYNIKNRWRKRGIGVAVMDYELIYLGQFSATVSIYHSDGSVVISHGGIEVGQGMNTKIAQVAAYVLGIPLPYVKIETSDTINGANSFVTAGSFGTESCCFAVRKACRTLNDRLSPIKSELPKDATWQNIVQTAWEKKVNMIASESYKQGDMQNYRVYGLAITEVEVDILSGNNQIRRVDILEDAGESLSPHIDVGQVEGAFIMCLGYWLTEQLIYDRQTGQLLTNRTWNYKIPGVKDIPIDFRIELLKNESQAAGFMRSKATGEPPCCLAVSVLFALQQALQSARDDAALPKKWVEFVTPVTPEFIVLNAGTNPVNFSLK